MNASMNPNEFKGVLFLAERVLSQVKIKNLKHVL